MPFVTQPYVIYDSIEYIMNAIYSCAPPSGDPIIAQTLTLTLTLTLKE